MIPVQKYKKPEGFEKIEKKGSKFLQKTPQPTQGQWKSHNYWTHVLNDLGDLYDGVCAYSAVWLSESARTVDHFIAKTKDPKLAYTWSNYRLASNLVNGFKGKQKVIDPFKVQMGMFELHFPSLQVKPGEAWREVDKPTIQKTIDNLKLNNRKLVRERKNWIKEMCNYPELDMSFLKRKAPFIGNELVRLGYVDKESIKKLMSDKTM